MLLQGLQSEPGPQVVVDATALGRFDSSALAVLLELPPRRPARWARHWPFGPCRNACATLATLYGIAELLPAA
jgi:phospholipid transport system transporter-binding protein